MEIQVRKLLDQQHWGTITKKLTLYAYSRFKFWNLLTEVGVMGYSPEEVALEAISLVYTGVWQWDPAKSDLLSYLKYHVVKGLVANLARSKEVRNTWDVVGAESENNFSIEEELNAKLITEGIRESLKPERILLNIFEHLLTGMKRSEIIELLNISESEYDNALRRLKARVMKFNKMVIAK